MKYLILFSLLVFTGCGNPAAFTRIIEGTPGPTGLQGESGIAGVGCSVAQVTGGAVVTCGPDVVLVTNGTNGVQGATGPTGAQGQAGQDAPLQVYSVTEIIDPCGKQGNYDEVLLALGNGSLVALFTNNVNGDYPRLSLIPDGNFMTSDTTSCVFSVSTQGNVRTVTWNNGFKSWNFN